MLKKFLLGGDAVPTAGDGFGARMTPRPTVERERSSISKASRPVSISESAGHASTASLASPSASTLAQDPQEPSKARRSSNLNDAVSLSQPASPCTENVLVSSSQAENTNHQRSEQKKAASWQDYEIPKELALLDEDVPQDIRNIIQESLDEQEAVRVSRLLSPEAEDNASIKFETRSIDGSLNDEEVSLLGVPLSVASSPTSENTEHVDRSFNRSQESVTTPGSESADTPYLQPPKLSKLRIGSHKRQLLRSKNGQQGPSSPGSGSALTSMESRFHDFKDKTSKGRGLYSLLKGRKTKSTVEGSLPPKREPPLQSNAHAASTTFHPKCDHEKIYLPEDLARFDEKTLEYAVPLANRYYCTEADQRRREEQIQAAQTQREADAHAEAEEIRLAIEAVEEAERHLRVEREAEEAREHQRLEREAEELAQLELERAEQIRQRFLELRAFLDRVGLRQMQAMEKRHFEEEEANDRLLVDFEDVVSGREKEINAERETKVAENEKSVKLLQRKHAAALMETFQRHRRGQDDLFTKNIDNDDNDTDQDMVKASRLEALMPLQETERTMLKQQQAREVEKWKQRGQQALNRLNIPFKVQQMRFQEEEKMMRIIHEGNEQRDADLQWFGVLQAARAAMLDDDERRLLSTGGRRPILMWERGRGRGRIKMKEERPILD
ncbi:uncharacterized protein KY384_005335 [Bacidia gigantensis]|uniref:uncharacterized protein n=1 Tax=Bacidia gigantensis TaxID=2732470 RepID=UPI001D046AD5|nr:uncharacterized protein KY384_005335 [Bacidia gigantensis]KAG8529854.1 hypothetical protein KY384_005335 [Bacidia gigantensis]